MALKVIKANERIVKPPRVLVFGEKGIGKTTLAAGFPNPYFIQTEDGFGRKIRCDGYPVKNLQEFNEILRDFSTEEHDYKTLVVDHIDDVEAFTHRHIIDSDPRATSINTACGGYGNGLKVANNFWREKILPKFNALREKGIIILLLAHASTETIKDPIAGDVLNYYPSVDRQLAHTLYNWTDDFLFATFRNGTMKGDNKTNQRVLKMKKTQYYDAKNRYADDEISEVDMSFADYASAIHFNEF